MTDGETIVRMPKLADTLVEGTLGQWLKQAGQIVRRGEPLASIETDKVSTELTSPMEGTVIELLVVEGQTVPIETPIARIATTVSVAHAPAPETRSRPKPTPVAARILAEHGLTPNDVPSHSLRLKRDDVLSYVSAKPATKVSPLSSMRRAIAEHMTRAYETIPQGQTVMSVDLSDVVPWREQRKAEIPHLTFTALFVHALSRAMESPAHIGVAVALQTGLIVPVLRGADTMSLPELASAIADIAARARGNRLTPDDVQGASMTVTNVGSFGNLLATPIVPLGQVAILAPGLVERRPMLTSPGGIQPGWRCWLSLVFDRRIFNDLAADQFLRAIVDQLSALAAR